MMERKIEHLLKVKDILTQEQFEKILASDWMKRMDKKGHGKGRPRGKRPKGPQCSNAPPPHE